MDKSLVLDTVSIAMNGSRLLSVNRTVAAGDVLTIMGPSGVGKSTLLSYITGTLPSAFDASGRILLHGEDITNAAPHNRRIGILFQDDLLFPHLSVGGNLAFGLPKGGTRAERADRINAALADVGLVGFADHDPDTLSGGQKARVALMRVLLAGPCALLLDEPFSRLDAALRDQIRSLVFQRAKAYQLPVVMVTHDLEDAQAAGGDIITLSAANSGDAAP
jgi:putative thiamine transport system ATP-binding protein